MQEISDLSFFQDKGNVLILTGCSKNKLNTEQEVPAEELYTGTLFRFVKEYADSINADLYIISAKYGLISRNTLIKTYDKVLRTYADAESLRPEIERELSLLHGGYDQILVIAGDKYRRTLKGIADERYYFLKTSGIGHTLHLLKEQIS